MHLYTPLIRGSVGLGCGLIGLSHRPLPTKTSRSLNQLTCKSQCLCRAFFHVFFISFVYVLFLTIFIAAIQLHVNRSMIFLSHLVPRNLAGQSPGLFPYGGRESWHVQENGRIYCESVDSWGQGGNVRVCQCGVLTL